LLSAKFKRHRRALSFLLCFVLGALNIQVYAESAEQNRPKLLASIRPLVLIVNEIAGDKVETEVLLRASTSPHDFSLTISQAIQLDEADLLIWVGPPFEHFLKGIPQVKRQLTMFVDESVVGTQAAGRHHHSTHEAGHNGSHTHDLQNTHLWLSTERVIDFSERLRASLTSLLPESSEYFAARQQRFMQRLSSQLEVSRQRLKAFKLQPFAVYHDAYGFFVAEHQLNQALSLTAVPHERISAKRLSEIGQAMVGVRCLLTERAELKQAGRYASLFEVPLVALDLLAENENIQDFIAYREAMLASFVQCLSK